LLVRIRNADDEEAWQTFVAIYAPLVYGYARRHGLQDADAADLTQETMSEVARSMRSFEYHPEKGRFRDWLRTIARRRLLRFDHRKRRLTEHSCDGDAIEGIAGQDVDEDWDGAFSSQVLQAGLERAKPHFEPTTWRAFERVWLDGQTPAETAQELAMGITSVYLAKSRVLKRLEQEIRQIADEFTWLDSIEQPPDRSRVEA
jgi:RNA polymerase sigma-70 factor (ECF subfamily)